MSLLHLSFIINSEVLFVNSKQRPRAHEKSFIRLYLYLGT